MSVIRDSRIAMPLMPYSLRLATEAAARAAYDWIGRGDRSQGDAAAILAMEAELRRLPMTGTIVIGEGKRDECSSLYTGQEIGAAGQPGAWDIVVDPIEGTSYLMRGMTNAMACIAIAPRGTLFEPGPAFYMEKLARPLFAAALIPTHRSRKSCGCWPSVSASRFLTCPSMCWKSRAIGIWWSVCTRPERG